MELKGHERTRRRGRESVRSDSPYVESKEGLHNVKIKRNREKKVSHLVKDADKSRNFGGALLLGRKRLNSTLSHDHADMQLEPSRKHQRKTRQSGTGDVEGVSSDCMLMMQMPSSDDCDPSSLNPTSGCEELPIGCKDQECKNPEVLISKPPDDVEVEDEEEDEDSLSEEEDEDLSVKQKL